MLEAKGNELYMHAGDFGIALPFWIQGGELVVGDVVRFSVARTAGTVLHKDYPVETLQEGAFLLTFTEEESALLPAGRYLWKLVLLHEGLERSTVLGPCLLTVLEG